METIGDSTHVNILTKMWEKKNCFFKKGFFKNYINN
jgi:hypothetical protein